MNLEGLKVALVFDDSLDRVGGVGQYVRALAQGLRQLGVQPTFLVGQTTAEQIGGVRVCSMSRNVPVRSNGGAGTMPLPSSARSVEAVLEEGAFDVVHVQMPYSPLMAGRIISRLDPRVALIGTYHVSTERPLARIGARMLGRACRRSMRRFDQTVAVSETAALSARQMFGLEVDRIIPNMVDVGRFRATAPNRYARHHGPHLVYLGTLTPRKGVQHLLGAAALLRPCFPQLRVTIAGAGPMAESLQRRARGLDLAETVNFVGEISEREKTVLFWTADLACFPASYGESFGVVLLEAMAAGTPVLAADNPGFAELIARQALCSPRPQDIAVAARGILENSTLRAEIQHAQQALVATFDIDRVTSRVAAAYLEALHCRERLLAQKRVPVRELAYA